MSAEPAMDPSENQAGNIQGLSLLIVRPTPYSAAVPKPSFIELGRGRHLVCIPILYEDRSVIAIDKPAGWMLVPFSWQRTQRNLQAAIASSIGAGDFWARSRNLKFLRYVHRLDGDTSGVLLMARSPGATETYGDLFKSRQMEKRYLAVVHGVPNQTEWICRARLSPDRQQIGRVIVDRKKGKDAETAFRVLRRAGGRALIEAHPITGRTHQIRVHLLAAGHPVVGDDLYGPGTRRWPIRESRVPPQFPLGLRAVELAYLDPFQRRPVQIVAPSEEFLAWFGMEGGPLDMRKPATPSAGINRF
jgi:RluA family pseudouridine synthase